MEGVRYLYFSATIITGVKFLPKTSTNVHEKRLSHKHSKFSIKFWALFFEMPADIFIPLFGFRIMKASQKIGRYSKGIIRMKIKEYELLIGYLISCGRVGWGYSDRIFARLVLYRQLTLLCINYLSYVDLRIQFCHRQ